jgi:hypothetical protein
MQDATPANAKPRIRNSRHWNTRPWHRRRDRDVARHRGTDLPHDRSAAQGVEARSVVPLRRSRSLPRPTGSASMGRLSTSQRHLNIRGSGSRAVAHGRSRRVVIKQWADDSNENREQLDVSTSAGRSVRYNPSSTRSRSRTSVTTSAGAFASNATCRACQSRFLT